MGAMNRNRDQERKWVVRAQVGDLKAFDSLARSVRSGLVAIAALRLNRDLAEDVAQDSLLIAFKVLPGLRDPGRFRPWIGAITRNQTLRILEREPSTAPLDDLIRAYAPGVFETVLLSEQASRILCAIENAPGDVRVVMELHFVHGWSVQDISEFLGLPMTTVKWRLHTGRNTLRRQFDLKLEN